MLRDMEKGAFRAIVAYNTPRDPRRDLEDAVVDSWLRGKHPTARLIDHAEKSYDITFRLAYTRRPWAEYLSDGDSITGRPGYLWHAMFYMRGVGVRAKDLWGNSYLTLARDHLVFLSIDDPLHVDFSFPAVDDPQTIADDIASCMEAVLSACRSTDSLKEYMQREAWHSPNIDPRLQMATAWTIVDESTVPISIFSAG